MAQKRLIYVGGIYSERQLLRNAAVSTAGERWQRLLLAPVQKLAPSLEFIAHQQERTFPFGPLWPSADGFDFGPCPAHRVRYINAPGIRMRSLRAGYRRAFDRAVAGRAAPTQVLCYNATPWSVELAQYARTRYRIPTFCIHADFADPGDRWSTLVQQASAFAGNVFLSYAAYQGCAVPAKLHLDGGFSRASVKQPARPDGNRLVYAGAIARSKGVCKLIATVRSMARDQVQLHLFGKIDARDGGHDIIADLEGEPNIVYHGVVPYAELDESLAAAAVLVNPVDVSMPGNALNFPSKLLHYLEMGPPVVTALVEGMAPAYASLVQPVEHDAEISCWREAIERALAESAVERRNRIAATEAFMHVHSWSNQAERLLAWMSSTVSAV